MVDFKYNFNRILFVNSYACNMNCPYCMHMEHKKNAKIKPGMQFGLEKSKELFDTFIENSPHKVLRITFSGGEPLVFYESYIKPMILYMRERAKDFPDKKVILDMFTNGSLLTDEILDFFREQDFSIGISYDGHCGQEYRDKKTQDIVERNIKRAIEKNGDLVACASTFYKDSFPYIFDAYMTMVEMGCKKWSFAVDTLSTNTTAYTVEDCQLLGEQIKKVWDEMPKHDIKVNTFDRVKNFAEYAESNRAIIARPDGEICIGTTVPILIPEELFPYFSLGYWQIDKEKYRQYMEVMGDFHIHVMGKNDPSFCEACLVKSMCQDVKITAAEYRVRKEADPMHCMENLMISHIVKGSW